jgi:integrase
LANPVATVQKIEYVQKEKRALENGELSALWSALKVEKGPAADALALILLTGCRAAETMAAKWEHIDLNVEQPIWTISSDVAKNHNEHIVFLSQQAVSRLEAIGGDHDGYIFAGAKAFGAPSVPLGHTTVRRKLKELLKRTEQSTTTSPHYFRHTVATFVGEHYGNAVRRRVLNHSTTDPMEKRYDHTTHDDKARDAWQAWGRKLDALADPTNNVVPLGGRRHGG